MTVQSWVVRLVNTMLFEVELISDDDGTLEAHGVVHVRQEAVCSVNQRRKELLFRGVMLAFSKT